MNKRRVEHAAVVCNGAVYVLGGCTIGNPTLDCIERIGIEDLFQLSGLIYVGHGNSRFHCGEWIVVDELDCSRHVRPHASWTTLN